MCAFQEKNSNKANSFTVKYFQEKRGQRGETRSTLHQISKKTESQPKDGMAVVDLQK